jgi:hypothetical protein
MKLTVCLALVVATVAFVPPVRAQQPAASTPPPAAPGLDFSGVAFGSFSMRTDSAAKATLGGKAPNQFNIDRVYLNFRMPAGDNGAIRVTTDVFQNTSTAATNYYNGWSIRIKYAYFQYTALRDQFGKGSNLVGRVGALHTVVIDHEEGFWPRYLGQVAAERAYAPSSGGFFASADVGAAGLLTLGNKMGELYATVTNGPGYTSYERDRFKDFAVRGSLTPLANHASMNAVARTLTISPWAYLGKVGSGFAAGGAGQIGPGTNGAITDGLTRNRYGVFAGVKERRLTGGIEYAQRKDESESGLNTTAVPRVVADSSGRVIDGFIVARPLEWMDATKKSALGVVARYDRFTANTSPTSANYAGTTPSYSFTVLGLSYDVNQRITLALDWQAQTPSGFPPATGTYVRPTPKQSTMFVHWQATF